MVPPAASRLQVPSHAFWKLLVTRLNSLASNPSSVPLASVNAYEPSLLKFAAAPLVFVALSDPMSITNGLPLLAARLNHVALTRSVPPPLAPVKSLICQKYSPPAAHRFVPLIVNVPGPTPLPRPGVSTPLFRMLTVPLPPATVSVPVPASAPLFVMTRLFWNRCWPLPPLSSCNVAACTPSPTAKSTPLL